MKIDNDTRILGVLGTPIKHTNSPAFHNEMMEKHGVNGAYFAFDVGPDRLEAAVEGLRALNTMGFSVTMPNKIAVLPYLDELSVEAKLSGSVNTVKNKDGKLIGYNTDGYGFIKELKKQGVIIINSKMTLIGTGGACAGICTQAALDGMREIVIFGIDDPTFEKGRELAERLNERTDCYVHIHLLSNEKLLRREIADSDILANATPLGMGKLEGKSVITDETMFDPNVFVVDVVYNPPVTKFMELAKSQGCRVVNGKDMLVNQAEKSFEIWTK